jgi:hypothetical protein
MLFLAQVRDAQPPVADPGVLRGRQSHVLTKRGRPTAGRFNPRLCARSDGRFAAPSRSWHGLLRPQALQHSARRGWPRQAWRLWPLAQDVRSRQSRRSAGKEFLWPPSAQARMCVLTPWPRMPLCTERVAVWHVQNKVIYTK